MDSPSEKRLSRRDFLRKAAETGKIGVTLLIPTWLAAACNFTAKTPATPTATVNTEKVGVPNLDLKIDEALFWITVRSGSRFGLLPDATDKSKLLLAYQNIYIGKTGSLFNIGINKPMADFLISQSKLLNPPLRTNIIFVEDWGEGDMISGEGGFTGIAKDDSEQNVVIWLKRAAWHAFKTAGKQGLASNALLVGIEPTINLNQLRAQIFQEARQRGFE